MNRSCLIIGAGMAGLAAAPLLRHAGWSVQLVDKARGVGGRMATRRTGDCRFDHGAQFFTARDPRFLQQVEQWESEGLVTPWFKEHGEIRYRAVGGTSTIAKRMAQSLDVTINFKVSKLLLQHRTWSAIADSGEQVHGAALLLTPPAPQSLALLETCAQSPVSVTAPLRNIEFDPCFALLATLAGPGAIPQPGYFRPPQPSPIEWISDNFQTGVSAGSAAACITVHATAAFSREHLEAPQEQVANLLLDSAAPWLGAPVASWQLHRWRYSRPQVDFGRPRCLFTANPAPLAIAGDAFGNDQFVESAFLSGLAAAEAIITG